MYRPDVDADVTGVVMRRHTILALALVVGLGGCSNANSTSTASRGTVRVQFTYAGLAPGVATISGAYGGQTFTCHGGTVKVNMLTITYASIDTLPLGDANQMLALYDGRNNLIGVPDTVQVLHTSTSTCALSYTFTNVLPVSGPIIVRSMRLVSDTLRNFTMREWRISQTRANSAAISIDGTGSWL